MVDCFLLFNPILCIKSLLSLIICANGTISVMSRWFLLFSLILPFPRPWSSQVLLLRCPAVNPQAYSSMCGPLHGPYYICPPLPRTWLSRSFHSGPLSTPSAHFWATNSRFTFLTAYLWLCGVPDRYPKEKGLWLWGQGRLCVNVGWEQRLRRCC